MKRIRDIIRYTLIALLIVVVGMMIIELTHILCAIFGHSTIVLISIVAFVVCFVWLCMVANAYEVDDDIDLDITDDEDSETKE